MRNNRISALRICCAAFIITGAFLPASAQVFPHVNYSVRQGLLNSNVYAIAQDPMGYLWFGTESGLSRFDGKGFRNFPLGRLGARTHITSLLIDEEGKIIFGSGSDGIMRFDPLTEKTHPLISGNIIRSNQLIIDGDLLISLHEKRAFDFFSMETGKPLYADEVFSGNTDLKALSMVKLRSGEILLGRTDGLYRFANGRQHKLNIPGFDNSAVGSIHESGSQLLLGCKGKIYYLENYKVIRVFYPEGGQEHLIRNLQTDHKGNLWFNLWGLGDLYLQTGPKCVNISKTAGVNAGLITGIWVEKSGTVVVSGLGKGFYIFNNTHLLNYYESSLFTNANIQKIAGLDSGGLLLGTDDGLAYLNASGDSVTAFDHDGTAPYFIKDLVRQDSHTYIAATIDEKLAETFSGTYKLPDQDISYRYTHGSSVWCDSGMVLVGNWDNRIIHYHTPAYRMTGSTNNIFSSTSNTHRINCISRDRMGRLWYGSQKGLCLQESGREKSFPAGPFQDDEVFEISFLENDEVLVVSNTGFFILKNHHDKLQIKPTYHYASAGINCVERLGDREYLLGTNHGLVYLNDKQVTVRTIHDGLPSDNINDIYWKKGDPYAWIGSSEGLSRLELHAIRNERPEPPQITALSLWQNGERYRAGSPITFPYGKNSFRISFQAFHYNNPQNIRYRYRIDGQEWLPSKTNEIQFASMEPGEHLLELNSGLGNANWGNVATLRITILPPFYRTWWFLLFAGLTLALILWLYIRFRLRTLRARQEEKNRISRKMNELQQKALASNLNPHFVFNSLNAIQHFINSRSPEQANDYLAKFARLMRMHLNMAEKSSILLHEEISRLEYYLGLEQMRFGDRLRWQVNIDPAIDPYHTEIPNMIIQPFVENAIWHGIMPSTEPGRITLEFRPGQQNGIQILITDNGVGFGYKPANGKPGHESRGTRLIRERLLLLDPHAGQVLSFESLTPGTRVTLYLTANMYRITHQMTRVG